MTNIKEQVKEVLIDLINAQAGAMGDMPIEQLSLDQALSQIHELYIKKFEEMLPFEFTASDFSLGKEYWKAYKEGFNNCLKEIKTKLEGTR